MSQFQVCRRVLVLVLALCLQGSLSAQRIKLFQLEQKGTPKQGYFGLTNSDGNQVYTEFESSVITIIDANGHWYLNGIDDAYGVSTISPGETVAFTGNDGTFRGIVAGLLFSGTNTIFIDGRALQWNLGANGSYTTIGDVQGSSESVNFVGSGSVSTSRSGNTITITGTDSDSGTDWDLGANGSYTIINNGEQVNFVGAGIAVTSRLSNTITITATEVDGSTSNEIDTWDLGANSSYTNISNGEQVNFVGAGDVTTSRTGNTITITGSGSGTDLTFSGASSPYTLNSSTGTDVTFASGGIISLSRSVNQLTISATEVDGSTTNEIQGLDWFNASSPVTLYADGSADGAMIVAGSGISLSMAADQLTITATDASVTNEAQTWSNSGTTSYTGTLSTAGGAGGGSFTIAAGSNVSVSHSAGTVTIASSFTEVDGSVTNEAQTWSNSGTTSYTGTLSTAGGAGGGAFTIAAGSNVTVSHSAGTVTIAASAGSTDLTFTGASSPYTLNSSTGTDVTFAQGGIVTLSRSTNQLTISATEVDGSTSNELQDLSVSDITSIGANIDISSGASIQIYESGIINVDGSAGYIEISASEVDGSVTNEAQTWSNSGTTSYTGTLSTAGGAGGGAFTIAAGSNVTVSHSAGTVTIAASFTEVDGSTTNELDTWDLGANGSYTTISNAEQVNFVGAGIASTSRSTNTITITATEVDGSVTNESQTWSNSGTTSYTGTLSTAGGAGGGAFTIAAGSNVTVSHSAGTVTIASSFTEVDGSTSNELQTIAVTGTTTGITTLSNSGGSMTIAAGGINSIGVSGSTITITATEADGSVTNEAQTWSNSGTTSYTGTLSTAGGAGGGAFTIAAGSNVTVSHSAGTVTIASSFTEVDGSTSNELDTWDLGANASYTTISNAEQVNFVGAGIAVTSRSTNTITITATEVDGSVTNEAQTWSNSGTTSYTGTLSTAGGAGGGAFTIAAGSNVTVSHSAGTVTIAASAGSTDLTFTGASSPYTLNSSTGTDVTFAQGNNITLSRSSNQLTVAQPAFTDLATGFSSGYVIYVDASGTPQSETGFSYNEGGNILTVGYIIATGIDLTGIGQTTGESRWLTRNSGSNAVGYAYKTSGYYQTKSGGTAINAGDSYIRITGSGTYNMPPGGASDERHLIAIFNDSGGNITLSRINSGLIDGATTKVVADQTLLICVSIGGSNVDEWITK